MLLMHRVDPLSAEISQCGEVLVAVRGSPEDIVEFAEASGLASDVTLEPWNSSFRRRSKPSELALEFTSRVRLLPRLEMCSLH